MNKTSNAYIGGKLAFIIGVAIQNNPHKQQPQRDQWEKGHRAARRFFDRNRRCEVIIGGKVYR